MDLTQIFSICGLLIYFLFLLYVVAKDNKNKHKNIIDYFFAGRALPFWTLSITFIASWWGAGSAISTADLAFEDGMGAFWYYGVPVLVSTFLMIIGSKAIRRINYLTQGEMMEARYSKTVGKLLAVMIFIFMTVTAASQMVAIGSFFGTYLGINYEIAVIVGTSIVLIYSLFGGFKGVVLTDIIQFVLLLISALLVFAVALFHSGGFNEIARKALELGKTDYMNVTAGVDKYLSYVITFGCAWLIQANVWQRISAAKSDKDAYKMTIMSFIIYIPLYLIVVFTGMASITLFETIPEGGVITNIVTNYMPPILKTIVFIGISAAIMSTMDSLINTGAMTLVIDLLPKNIEDEKKLKLSRVATFLVTIIALIISLKIRSILDISWIASDIITTGVFIPLILGFIWKKGNSKGALTSMLTGFIYCLYNLLIDFGIPLYRSWQPHSTAQVLIGVSLSATVYILVSLITNTEYNKSEIFILKAQLFKK